ncbi:MAG: AAA family ATPase [Anaerolineae bacterium]
MSSTAQTVGERIVRNVSQVIIGKKREIMLTVIGLLCEGHLLIEDVPGVGKTMLANALARSIGCSFSRIQFTPDMLPSDITGVSIFNQRTQEFEFRSGPLMAQIVLADEINRTTPKTQSALLEAMEEYQVTADGTTYELARPFMVMATQNPIEYEGTFPLPEAQLDRILLRIHLGYPEPNEELAILDAQQYQHPVESIEQVVSVDQLLRAQEEVRSVYLDNQVKRYIVDLVTATRHHDAVYLGASPRGSLSLYRACQARAVLAGRDHVLPDDVKDMAESTLAHRIIVGRTARITDMTVNAENIIADILRRTPVPGATLGMR